MLTLTGDKIAVDPVFDSDRTDGPAFYTELERKIFEETGGFKDGVDKSLTLIVPDEAKKKANQGLVKYIGPECKDISVGDYVLFSGYSGTTVRLEGEGLVIIMPEDFIICKVDPPETDIEGLLFRDSEGELWTCTYEMVTEFMRRTFQEKQYIKAEVSKPKPSEIRRGIG